MTKRHTITLIRDRLCNGYLHLQAGSSRNPKPHDVGCALGQLFLQTNRSTPATHWSNNPEISLALERVLSRELEERVWALVGRGCPSKQNQTAVANLNNLVLTTDSATDAQRQAAEVLIVDILATCGIDATWVDTAGDAPLQELFGETVEARPASKEAVTS